MREQNNNTSHYNLDLCLYSQPLPQAVVNELNCECGKNNVLVPTVIITCRWSTEPTPDHCYFSSEIFVNYLAVSLLDFISGLLSLYSWENRNLWALK